MNRTLSITHAARVGANVVEQAEGVLPLPFTIQSDIGFDGRHFEQVRLIFSGFEAFRAVELWAEANEAGWTTTAPDQSGRESIHSTFEVDGVVIVATSNRDADEHAAAFDRMMQGA